MVSMLWQPQECCHHAVAAKISVSGPAKTLLNSLVRENYDLNMMAIRKLHGKITDLDMDFDYSVQIGAILSEQVLEIPCLIRRVPTWNDCISRITNLSFNITALVSR